MITNNSNNYYVFLNVFMFRIMSMTLRNINPQKETFHHCDFPVYTTSKYRDPKLDTYRRITQFATHDGQHCYSACFCPDVKLRIVQSCVICVTRCDFSQLQIIFRSQRIQQGGSVVQRFMGLPRTRKGHGSSPQQGRLLRFNQFPFPQF